MVTSPIVSRKRSRGDYDAETIKLSAKATLDDLWRALGSPKVVKIYQKKHKATDRQGAIHMGWWMARFKNLWVPVYAWIEDPAPKSSWLSGIPSNLMDRLRISYIYWHSAVSAVDRSGRQAALEFRLHRCRNVIAVEKDLPKNEIAVKEANDARKEMASVVAQLKRMGKL